MKIFIAAVIKKQLGLMIDWTGWSRRMKEKRR